MAKAKTYGTGWHGQSLRHSNARKHGKAGGQYATLMKKVQKQKYMTASDREKYEKTPYSVISKYHKLKDSDGDGVPDKYDCQPYNPRAQDTFTLPEGYTLETRTKHTRSGTREISVLLKDGKEISEGSYFWSNRPWQQYTYDKSNKSAINNADLPKEVKEKLKNTLDKEETEKFEQENKSLKAMGILAEIMSTSKEQANRNKINLLKAKYGEVLDVPEDFHKLPEAEKERRLNLAIGINKRAEARKKYEFKDLDTNKKINVSASNPDEAITKMNLKAGKKVNYTYEGKQ